ncbi:hypothetical protein CDN99_11605 [Roseateles aquatilis]|uniref:DUF3325 domain-containing protein n=1 Tax=Roseateles aquatilis TaxID=431061 RepID=A0A246JEW5_9BURK|nr:DUF3325 domain-containing protein [Roseateles aquatilis]OWQ90806.1 hypothetical protein CDN99_11605 [Roseateles aquatilis]
MSDPTLFFCGAALAALAGFGWLALAMDTHWEQVHGAAPRSAGAVRALRVAGCLGLAASLALCLMADHPSMAALVWLMLLAASAVAVGMALSTRPAWLRVLWPRGRSAAA